MSDTPITDSEGLAFRLRAISEDKRYAWNEWSEDVLCQSAARIEELERENARLREAGKALRDALAFECHKLGDCPREIDEWDALVSASA